MLLLVVLTFFLTLMAWLFGDVGYLSAVATVGVVAGSSLGAAALAGIDALVVFGAFDFW